MGSRSRKRKTLSRLYGEIEQRVGESGTPRVQAVKELSDLRMRGAIKTPKPRQRHVLAKESSAHQYIGGSRARGVSLTASERAMNRRMRGKSFRSQGAERIDRTRGNQGYIVSGRELSDKDLHTVHVERGEVKRLTTDQKRARAFGKL